MNMRESSAGSQREDRERAASMEVTVVQQLFQRLAPKWLQTDDTIRVVQKVTLFQRVLSPRVAGREDTRAHGEAQH